MNQNSNEEDCLACKVTSVACLGSIGTYLIYQSGRQTAKSKYTLIGLGAGCISLGIGEIFDKSPFREKKQNST